MKKILIRKTMLCTIFTFTCLSWTVIHADHDTGKGLTGPAFSDPSQIQEMPAEWIKQPIKHDSSAGEVDLAITLDQRLYTPFLPLIEKYAREHNLKVSVSEGTCGISSGMLSRKTADIGGFCCPPGKIERLPGLRFHTVGIDAKAILVHPKNPIDNITAEQARKLFAGEIHRWSELKTSKGTRGPDLSVQPVTRLHCKLMPGHWRLLLANEDLFSPDASEVGAIPDMISQVASNPKAIGYEVLWNAARYKDRGEVKALRINGYSPSDTGGLISGEYPFYRVYNLTTWEGKGLANPKAQKIVEYIIKHIEKFGQEDNIDIIPASRLREAGWIFKGTELIGEPKK